MAMNSLQLEPHVWQKLPLDNTVVKWQNLSVTNIKMIEAESEEEMEANQGFYFLIRPMQFAETTGQGQVFFCAEREAKLVYYPVNLAAHEEE